MSDFESIKEEIMRGVDHSNFIAGLYDTGTILEYGDYVLSGLCSDGSRALGYVVQVRKKWGAFGSDMFFIRDHRGGLATHENQSFWKLTERQTEAVKRFFKYMPNEELVDNPDIFYSVKDNFREQGFIVEPDNAPERVDSFAIAMTISKAG